jgi:hypothetical protein
MRQKLFAYHLSFRPQAIDIRRQSRIGQGPVQRVVASHDGIGDAQVGLRAGSQSTCFKVIHFRIPIPGLVFLRPRFAAVRIHAEFSVAQHLTDGNALRLQFFQLEIP